MHISLLLRVSALGILLLGAATDVFAAAAPPPCLEDGDLPDDENCANYYECLAGGATLKTCPYGLFFNNVTNLCDWAHYVSCELTLPQVLEQLTLPSPVYLYLTLDDSPGDGTNYTLDALLAEGIETTFFINVGNMADNAERQRMVMRMINEGHTLADHSYDHMAHNWDNDGGFYQDVDEDFRYFGEMGLTPLVDLMESEGLSQADIDRVSSTFSTYARMPYTNHWRMPGRFRYDCPDCTSPPTTVYVSRQISDRLEEEKGLSVIGWDLEWYTDYETVLYQRGAVGMLMEMSSWSNFMKGKIVVLTHSFMHDPPELHGDYNFQEFQLFLSLAKQVGYQFRKIETYITDVPQ